jgi:5-epi-alpha-selinene synthase
MNLPGWSAHTYPHAPLEILEIISEFMILMFLFDDECEKAAISKRSEWLAPTHARFVDILKGAELTDSDTLFARALADIRPRLLQYATSEWMLRFTGCVEDYFKGVLWEATNYSQEITLDVATYIQLGHLASGADFCFVFLYLTEQLALPFEVMEHPIVKRLYLAACHIAGWANDIFSAEKEIREGWDHNLVVILQNEHQLSLQEAIERAASLHDVEVRTFIELSAQLPSFGAEIDAELQRYLSALRFLMRGSLDWQQESLRYRPTETTPLAA